MSLLSRLMRECNRDGNLAVLDRAKAIEFFRTEWSLYPDSRVYPTMIALLSGEKSPRVATMYVEEKLRKATVRGPEILDFENRMYYEGLMTEKDEKKETWHGDLW